MYEAMYVVAASSAHQVSGEMVPAGACHAYRFGDRYTLCYAIHLSELATLPLLPFPPQPETNVDICDDCLRRAGGPEPIF